MRNRCALFGIGRRRNRVSRPVEFRAEPEEETRDDKNEDPFLFGREHNSAQAPMLTCGRAAEK
jgi:hypothetical protein